MTYAMEMYAVFEQNRVQKLVETLTGCLSELDAVGAQIAAAHVDSALHALQRQYGATLNTSKAE
jgi:hypothetical protein